METRVLPLGKDPSTWQSALADAAAILRTGGLVAFPTETVYGLGANALDPQAVARIYAAKGRPARNPVIVHVHSVEQAKSLVTDWPENADLLTKKFWPGPLTIILPKASAIPDVVTGGGSTVAIRMPSHPVALALLRECDLPIAAPSANRSEQLSATTAGHVLKGLSGMIDLLLDGGPTSGGLESTVVDLTVHPPVIRRPGLVSQAMIEDVVSLGTATNHDNQSEPLLSPGMMTRHYAPRVPLRIVNQLPSSASAKTGYLLFDDSDAPVEGIIERLPGDAVGYSAGLYSALHRLEDQEIDQILVEAPPQGDAWVAVHDRLHRAASEE